jgi:hypothetical protein
MVDGRKDPFATEWLLYWYYNSLAITIYTAGG